MTGLFLVKRGDGGEIVIPAGDGDGDGCFSRLDLDDDGGADISVGSGVMHFLFMVACYFV